MNELKTVKKELRKGIMPIIAFLVAITMIFGVAIPVSGATTADVSVNATPSYVSIAVNASSYDFGVIATSAYSNSSEQQFEIDNTSTIQTDQTIAVVNATWLGGTAWTHDDTATIGADTCAMLANKGGTWGTGDVIVKNASPNYIAENQAADTDYKFGLSLQAPSSFSDGVIKSNVVRISAAAG